MNSQAFKLKFMVLSRTSCKALPVLYFKWILKLILFYFIVIANVDLSHY